MSKKIVVSIILAFVISFGFLLGFFLIVENYFPSEQIIREREFYTKKFSLEDNLIFLMGSSQVGQLNNTMIHENISQKFPHDMVYNLSISNDTPSERIKIIDKIIELNPKIVLYGISYRDFYVDLIEKHPLPDPQQFFNDILLNEIDESNKINPKVITLEFIREIFLDTGLFPSREVIRSDYTPFYNVNSFLMVINEIELKEPKDYQQNILTIKSNLKEKQVRDLNLIIEKLQKNKIKVIIFTTPLHQNHLNQISSETKLNFSNILDRISNTYDIKIYDFSDKYVDEDIWSSPTHVAYNKKSSIFSEDITDIIITELKK